MDTLDIYFEQIRKAHAIYKHCVAQALKEHEDPTEILRSLVFQSVEETFSAVADSSFKGLVEYFMSGTGLSTQEDFINSIYSVIQTNQGEY
jgi:hypothetical protein